MRLACVALVAAGLLAIASLTFGQSLVCDESQTALVSARFEITVMEGSAPKTAKLLFGDLGDRCLPRPLVTALTYMIQWGKDGKPRTIDGFPQATFVFPATEFTLQDQVVADRATVVIKTVTLNTGMGVIRRTLILELVRQDVWRVIAVSLNG